MMFFLGVSCLKGFCSVTFINWFSLKFYNKMLTEVQGKRLLKLARDSIESWFDKKEIDFSKEKKKFIQKQGVFVTLTENGHLRGCIGFPYPMLPLSEAIFQAARAAAFDDPRFDALEKEEIDKINIEISILTVPKEIKAKDERILDEIVVGRDGLIVEANGCSGLLLPQVATEWNFNALQFLEACCEKAGLGKKSWHNHDCKIFKFSAQVFSEGKLIDDLHEMT